MVANPSAPVGFGKANSSEFGLVAPRKGSVSLDVTATVGSWSTVRAIGEYYKDQSGHHFLRLRNVGTCSSGGSITTNTLTLGGTTPVVFKNVANYFQSVSGGNNTTAGVCKGYVNPGVGTIVLEHASATTATVCVRSHQS